MHIAGFTALAETNGSGFTIILVVAVFLHPAAEVPVTIYVILVVGETAFGFPIPTPLFHV